MKWIEQIGKDPVLCIAPFSYRKRILKEMEKENFFYHIQFMTKEEFQKNLLYEYHPQALWKYSMHFKMIPENAKKEMDALYAIFDNSSFPELYNRKEWLKQNHLLIFHPAFSDSLSKKKIVVYGYEPYEMKFLESVLSQPLEYIKEEKKEYLPEITEYETLEQEVVGTAEKITMLIKDGVSPEHIFLGVVSEDYQSVIDKVFREFHIPLEKKESHHLLEYAMGQKFLELISWDSPMSNLITVLEQLTTSYPKENPVFLEIYHKLVSILNHYYNPSLFCFEIRDILLYELKHTMISSIHQKNVLQEIDFKSTLLGEDDYVFLMGSNLGEFPSIYEDHDYFKDSDKKELHLLTSLEKTSGEEQKIVKKILELPHVFVSYKKKSPFKEYLPATWIENWTADSKITVQEGKYHYSNRYYNDYLWNVSLDELVKYNQKNKHFQILSGRSNSYYQSYQNEFQGIDPKYMKEKLPVCTLSYTGMQKYFECPFKYYLHDILKVDPPVEATPSLIVGNLFHEILESYFRTKGDLDTIILEKLSTIEIEPVEKKEFYFVKYQKEIKRLIALMEKQNSNSSFEATYFEEQIAWTEQQQIKFRIYGKIDKIMTFQDEENAYAIVIDYKTGNASSNLSKVVYGLNMQLLLYLYFLSKDSRFSKFQLGGAYIQSIFSSIPNYTEGKTEEELLWEQSKLDGITLKRTSLIEKLDHYYNTASYLQGIRVKNDGDFYASARLLEGSTLEQLLELVKQNIEIVKEAIETAKFPIEPKKFSNESGEIASSCKYCSYRDICYLKPKNVKTLKEYKNLEFLKGGVESDS